MVLKEGWAGVVFMRSVIFPGALLMPSMVVLPAEKEVRRGEISGVVGEDGAIKCYGWVKLKFPRS